MIVFDSETQVRQRDKARNTATVGGLSGADLDAIMDSRATGAAVEVQFEGDPIPYRWTTTHIRDDGRDLTFDGETAKALDLMPLTEKQEEFRKMVNAEIVERLKAYLGKPLPSVAAIPAGEEGFEYDSKGDWKAKT